MVDRVGQRLGKYRLIRLLGRGGFAEVYLGEHLRLSTQAAVKVLYTRLANHTEVECFEKEAHTIAHLSHPHIVRVFDFDVQDDTPFLVMDYATGGTLRQRHPKGSILPLPAIISYAKQVADALQYAHDQRLIHRDVKPENMLLGQRNEVLLSDFGIATIAHHTSTQSTQAMAGTVPYMAPEQVQGKPRPASDQYALGIVVYEWLSGGRPFNGTATEIAMQHVLAPIPSLRENGHTISPDVEQVVMTALAKDPKRRFGSVKAFATALEQASQVAQSYSPFLSRAPTTPDQPQQSAQRASPMTPLSQQILISPPSAGVHVPLVPPNQSKQPSNNSNVQSTLEPTHRSISRRTIVLGLGAAGLAVVGGGLIWLVSSQENHPSVVSGQTPTSIPHLTPTPTPIPLGMLLYTYRGHSSDVNAVAWSPYGRRIVSGSGFLLGSDTTVQVWDAADGSHVYIYRGHSDNVWSVAWSPNGRRIASGAWDNTAQVWDAADGGHAYTYHGHSGNVNAAIWSPDGTRIASGSDDKTVQVWDATTSKNLFTYRGHTDNVWSVAWSPNGRRIVSGSKDTTVQVWDAVDGGHAYTYRGHSDIVYTVAWSPDGRRVVSGSEDTTVRVWDAADDGHAYIYRGHSSFVNGVAWSPDGRRIASGGGDNTVQVWDATNGGNVYTYRGHSSSVYKIAWSPDGRRIASGSADQTVQVWGAG